MPKQLVVRKTKIKTHCPLMSTIARGAPKGFEPTIVPVSFIAGGIASLIVAVGAAS